MPEFLSVAPGRINLIGEHIDYNNLSVLPMAVDRDMRIRFRVREDPKVRVSSPLEEFETREFELASPIAPAPGGDWSNYVRAAAEGLQGAGYRLKRGFDGHVVGTVPVAAGMSSSSALVVASARALLHANAIEMPPLELASLMARAERYVGVAGGGMDQAASVNGRAGHALRIDFAPLGFEAIPMPSDWCWVVASSMVRAEKSAGRKEAYNERTRDCARALEQVWRVVHGEGGEGQPTYRALLKPKAGPQDSPTEGLLEHASTVLDEGLLRRFRHVVTESTRVDRAQGALRDGDPRTFGQLMLDSHRSLREDYEVSIRELDELVRIASEAGAHGARLTGAGFGGCVICLTSPQGLESVMDALAQQYFRPRGLDSERDPGCLDEVLFRVQPSQGARVEPVDRS